MYIHIYIYIILFLGETHRASLMNAYEKACECKGQGLGLHWKRHGNAKDNA